MLDNIIEDPDSSILSQSIFKKSARGSVDLTSDANHIVELAK